MSLAEAQEWAEEALTGDEYEEIFGVIDEDVEDVMINVRISANHKRMLDLEVSREGVTIRDIIEKLIEEHLPAIEEEDVAKV